MISFIVIGRNEGWRISNCLESIYKTIESNQLKDYELIYVDSNSTDDSIERAQKYTDVRVFKITGKYNAAIARNIGAKESKGEVLFFIDGDMEILPDFLPNVIKNDQFLYEFVSGTWIDYKYDTFGRLISKDQYDSSKKVDKLSSTTGGLFLIKRELWFEVGGMKNKMRRSQDLDIALRLAKRGIFLLRKKELLAIHHTVPYNDKKRMWKMLISGDNVYRVLLLRENILNHNEWILFLRGNYTFISLLLALILIMIFQKYIIVFLYFIVIVGRILFRKERSIRLLVSSMLYILIYEISMLLALFFYWPKSYNEKYVSMQ